MMMKKFMILAAILLISAGIRAQNDLHFLGATTGAACQSIKYYQAYVFTGTGSTLRSYYVGSGAAIPYQYNFEYRYQSEIVRMRIYDHFLFVCANYDGFSKWDISDPSNPVKVYDVLPDSAGTASQGVAFQGDTIYVAQLRKVSAYKDMGNSCVKIADFAFSTLSSFIVGVDVKNNICAVSQQHWGNQNGVKLYDASTFALISFYHQGNYLSENVVFGEDNHLLHVMGGTSINFLVPNGYFYTLDITNPASPQKVFSDTLTGIYLAAIALPYNAENINDTIYVASWGSIKPGGPLDTCYIRVYDATNPADVHRIQYLPGGLWNFDMSLNGHTMYVASEWYGILTVDISDFDHPQVPGKTATGGWNNDADVYGDKLLVANEGFGFKMYDISDPASPVLLKVNNDPGFCHRIRFSADGQYIYTCNLTHQGFRVYRSDSIIQVGAIQQAVCDGRLIVKGNRVFSELNNRLFILNVANPYAPFIDSIISMGINDMAAGNEKLYVTGNDSIRVFDISAGGLMPLADEVLGTGEDAVKIAVYDTICFVYVHGKGLVKYSLSFLKPNYELTELSADVLANGAPEFMAADTFGLYCAYRLHGLFAYDRQTIMPTGWYRGGLDHRRLANQYGVQNLFCRNKLIFLVEYFCQTSILTHINNYNDLRPSQDFSEHITIYPNPAADHINVLFNGGNFNPESVISIYNIRGELMRSFKTGARNLSGCQVNDFPFGLYFIYIRGEKESVYKFIKK